MLILGEKLYTQSDMEDILSENERLKRENEELKDKYETADLEREHLAKQFDEEREKIKELGKAHAEKNGVPVELAAEIAAELVFEFFKCKKSD